MPRSNPRQLAARIVADTLTASLDYSSDLARVICEDPRYEGIEAALLAAMPADQQKEMAAVDAAVPSFDERIQAALPSDDLREAFRRLSDVENRRAFARAAAAFLIGIELGRQLSVGGRGR
jgi:hypothetical protein